MILVGIVLQLEVDMISMKIWGCLILILSLTSCGDVPQDFCQANIVQNGLELRGAFVRGSNLKYSFEVCKAPDSLRNVRFSVYGALNEGQIGSLNLNTSVRLANVEGGLQTGDTFEVDFQSGSGDTWFVIYQDSGFILDDTVEIIRGNLLRLE